MSDKGTIGELACAAYMAREGYDVFFDTSGKTSFDFIAHKNGILIRVQVKTTSTRTPEDTGWIVTLKATRPNRTRSKHIQFDRNSCDVLAVFIEPDNRVVVIQANTIKQKSAIVVR
jgi:Holliday junction resolvase-like predicted endonuclease